MGGCLGRGKTCSPLYGVLPSYPVGRVSSPSQVCGRPAYSRENLAPPLPAKFLFEDLCFPSSSPPLSFFPHLLPFSLFASFSLESICFLLFFGFFLFLN